MNNNKEHTQLIKDICMQLSMYPGLEIWAPYTGAVYNEFRHCHQKTGKFHPSGMSDIFIHSEKVKIIYIEAKTGTGVQNDNQIKWQEMCERFHIPYKVCHTKYEALQFLRELGVIGKELDGI